ncbi:hypothetical protein ACN267_32195 [Micromonospora sp. WMMD734]|uniref:hypothetical protein n=1 Tax=Micromonospora sp. WMMD734 TaxID=3404129 RepID=UPI003B962B96
MNPLLLILLGGPVAIGGPLAVAIALCERHADQTAAAIRAQHAEPAPAPAQRPTTTIRPKELTR